MPSARLTKPRKKTALLTIGMKQSSRLTIAMIRAVTASPFPFGGCAAL